MTDARTYTAQEIAAAWNRALSEATAIAGDDQALDMLTGAGLSFPGTYADVLAAWNADADGARGLYNPDEVENGDTIRSDSCGDLVVNLAIGFLADPEAATDDVIAEAWRDLGLLDCDLPKGSPERAEAIVAEVRGWLA